MTTSSGPAPAQPPPLGRLAVRGALGGFLMGIANLVPGISGGTMLLAAGVYPQFIQAVADVTTLRLRRVSLVVLGSVGLAALVAFALLAGPVKDFVVNSRWMAYSLFIGLTLGGVPLVWRMLSDRRPAIWLAAAVGFAGMGALAYVQGAGVVPSGGGSSGFATMLFAGVAGASAMILPGVSGGYLLLVLGVYVTVLAGVDAFFDALKALDLAAAMAPLMGVVVPVGIGVVVGIVAVSNVLKWLLARYEQPTLGVLLGLLLGAVVGLWPFQQGVAPEPGTAFKGEVLTEETAAAVDPEDWPTATFTPTGGQIAGSLGLVVLGFLLTVGVARLGQDAGEAPH